MSPGRDVSGPCGRYTVTSTEPANLIGDDWAPKALELDLAYGHCVDGIFDLGKPPLAKQGLTCRGMSTEPGREAGHRPDCSIVVTTFEADPTERRVAGGDADAERELRAALAPGFWELAGPPVYSERRANGLEFVVLGRYGVVEEHHQAVAGEVLQGAVVHGDQLADQRVIFTQELE